MDITMAPMLKKLLKVDKVHTQDPSRKLSREDGGGHFYHNGLC